MQLKLSLTGAFEYEEDDAPLFIDTAFEYIYLQVDIGSPKPSNGILSIEVIKKGKDASKILPLYRKQISLKSQQVINDTISLNEYIPASGNFEILANLYDDDKNKLGFQKKGIQLLRNSKRVIVDVIALDDKNDNDVVDISKTFVAKYPIAQLKKNIAALLPIATEFEIPLVSNEGEGVAFDLLQNFFYNFWANRNATAPEKAWKEYVVKLNEAADKYGTATMPGYRTDRGRIFIKYGLPDKIERIMNEANALPHEIWFYYNTVNKGNVKFLFMQPGMMNSEMFLIHSNDATELVNPFWWQQLYTNPDDADNKLKHRAFEYFNRQ